MLCQNTRLKLKYNRTDTEKQLDNDNESQSRQLGAAFLVVGWIAAIGLIAVLINHTLFGVKKPSISDTYAGKEITIQRGHDSHFRIKGSINGIPVTFLIDTGATSVAVSANLAEKAGLKKQAAMNTETAGGETQGYFTVINKLEFAGIELSDTSAIIVDQLPAGEALLGMNVLQKFTINQSKDTMVLTVPTAQNTN